MRPLARYLLCVALAFSDLSCSVNILSTFSNTKSNEALYEDAVANMNALNFAGALTNIADMTGAFPSTPQVLELKASAFAGLCGLQTIPFVTAFSNMGATLLFQFLLKNFDFAVATNIANCETAQAIIQSIGPVAQRSADDNFFSAEISFATIGNILGYYADPTKTGAGTAGWDPCAVGGVEAPGGNMTDTDARNLGVALSMAIADLTAVANTVNLGAGSLAALSGLCTALPGAYDFCAVTDPALLTATEVSGVRSLIKESQVVGLGTNCTGGLATCNCP